MAKKKERVKSEGVALDMTPMIDVVFQLIIFFVVTLKQEDILSHLDAMAPSPDSKAAPAEKIEMLTIVNARGKVFSTAICRPKSGGWETEINSGGPC